MSNQRNRFHQASSRQELGIKYVADWLINPGIDWDPTPGWLNKYTTALSVYHTIDSSAHKETMIDHWADCWSESCSSGHQNYFIMRLLIQLSFSDRSQYLFVHLCQIRFCVFLFCLWKLKYSFQFCIYSRVKWDTNTENKRLVKRKKIRCTSHSYVILIASWASCDAQRVSWCYDYCGNYIDRRIPTDFTLWPSHVMEILVNLKSI